MQRGIFVLLALVLFSTAVFSESLNNASLCQLSSFDFVKASKESGLSFTHSCFSNNVAVNFAVFDSRGNAVYPVPLGSFVVLKDANSCNTSTKTYLATNWPNSTTQVGSYSARLFTDNSCIKEIFFSVSDAQSAAVIPDGNIFAALAVAACAAAMIGLRKKK